MSALTLTWIIIMDKASIHLGQRTRKSKFSKQPIYTHFIRLFVFVLKRQASPPRASTLNCWPHHKGAAWVPHTRASLEPRISGLSMRINHFATRGTQTICPNLIVRGDSIVLSRRQPRTEPGPGPWPRPAP